ncbi:MAG: dihydroorotase, partial [Candidatus Thorarchaeota archaeon]
LRDLGQAEKEDFASGTMAAAAGGITTVVDMPNSDPPTITIENLEEKIASAHSKRFINVGFYAGIPEKAEEFSDLLAPDILGIKVYPHKPLTESTRYTPKRVKECLELSVKHNIPLLFHPDTSSPEEIVKSHNDFFRLHSCESEVESLRLFIGMRAEVDARLHVCHVSCATSVRLIADNRAEELLTAEVTPHHLFLSGGANTYEDGQSKMLPPLRSPYDNEALLEALARCSIDILVSDHAPHTEAEKKISFLEASSGIPGLETTVPIMLTEVFEERLSWVEYLRFCCSGPARVLGLASKGVLSKGYDADIIVVAKDEYQIQGSKFLSKSKLTPFEGRRVMARSVMTIVGGQVVYDHGKFLVGPGVVGMVPVRKFV